MPLRRRARGKRQRADVTVIAEVLELHRRQVPVAEIAAACLTSFQRVEEIIRDSKVQRAIRLTARTSARKATTQLRGESVSSHTKPESHTGRSPRRDRPDDFGGQCERLLPNLRRYALHLTRDRVSAEDLIQDTMVNALHKQHQFAPGTDLRAWLFTIMHNQRMNGIRRASRQGIRVDLSEWSAAVSGGQEVNEEMRALRHALEQLPDDVRTVALLVGYDGLRYDEVAKKLRIPVGTVRSRLSRGRTFLRALMDREPPDRSPNTAAQRYCLPERIARRLTLQAAVPQQVQGRYVNGEQAVAPAGATMGSTTQRPSVAAEEARSTK